MSEGERQATYHPLRLAFDLFASLAAITILAPLAAFAIITASWRTPTPTDQHDGPTCKQS